MPFLRIFLDARKRVGGKGKGDGGKARRFFQRGLDETKHFDERAGTRSISEPRIFAGRARCPLRGRSIRRSSVGNAAVYSRLKTVSVPLSNAAQIASEAKRTRARIAGFKWVTGTTGVHGTELRSWRFHRQKWPLKFPSVIPVSRIVGIVGRNCNCSFVIRVSYFLSFPPPQVSFFPGKANGRLRSGRADNSSRVIRRNPPSGLRSYRSFVINRRIVSGRCRVHGSHKLCTVEGCGYVRTTYMRHETWLGTRGHSLRSCNLGRNLARAASLSLSLSVLHPYRVVRESCVSDAS